MKHTKKIVAVLSAVSALPLTAASVLAQSTVQVKPPRYSVVSVGALLSGLVTAAIIIAAIAAFIYLVWGGLSWLTSGGDKQKTEEAQKRITSAIIGLAIVAASWALIQLVASFFGLDFQSGITIPAIQTNQ